MPIILALGEGQGKQDNQKFKVIFISIMNTRPRIHESLSQNKTKELEAGYGGINLALS